MTIQRNSIDYIVLENDKVNFKKDIYVNDVLLTGGGSGNPFDENVVINDLYELQCNTFNNNGLNQDVVFNINSGEWFRLQFRLQNYFYYKIFILILYDLYHLVMI